MSGSKYVRLYGIEETSKLYVMKNNNTYGKQGNMSAIDCEREDFQKHPLAASALYTEAILNPGDALFIPSKMWHYVRGLSKSISVNFWS
jgi:lysine-specific demethylase 8